MYFCNKCNIQFPIRAMLKLDAGPGTGVNIYGDRRHPVPVVYVCPECSSTDILEIDVEKMKDHLV